VKRLERSDKVMRIETLHVKIILDKKIFKIKEGTQCEGKLIFKACLWLNTFT